MHVMFAFAYTIRCIVIFSHTIKHTTQNIHVHTSLETSLSKYLNYLYIYNDNRLLRFPVRSTFVFCKPTRSQQIRSSLLWLSFVRYKTLYFEFVFWPKCILNQTKFPCLIKPMFWFEPTYYDPSSPNILTRTCCYTISQKIIFHICFLVHIFVITQTKEFLHLVPYTYLFSNQRVRPFVTKSNKYIKTLQIVVLFHTLK